MVQVVKGGGGVKEGEGTCMQYTIDNFITKPVGTFTCTFSIYNFLTQIKCAHSHCVI